MGIESWFSWGRSEEGGPQETKKKDKIEPLPSSLNSYNLVNKAMEESGQLNDPPKKVVEVQRRSKPEPEKAEEKIAA